MNRIQFMTELAALLQDISVEERVEAMKYYNDYFDEAGEENEEEIVRELGSPAKVAAEVKAGLGEASSDAGEFRETGYTDTRFEQKEAPAYPGQEKDSDEAGGGTEKQQGKYTREEQRSNNNWDTGSEETKQKITGLKISADHIGDPGGRSRHCSGRYSADLCGGSGSCGSCGVVCRSGFCFRDGSFTWCDARGSRNSLPDTGSVGRTCADRRRPDHICDRTYYDGGVGEGMYDRTSRIRSGGSST